MKRLVDPFASVLNQASDRFYLKAVWLGDELRKDPLRTMHVLSTRPETYGEIKPCHDAEARRVRLNHLIDAAKAFIRANRKMLVDAVDQGELPL